MSDWSDAGLPCFRLDGYGYSIDPALVRTQFAARRPRQSRLNTSNRREIQLRALIPRSLLGVAEAFLTDQGYSWFSADVLTGDVQGAPLQAVQIRLISDYSLTARSSFFELRVAAEQKVVANDAVCANESECRPPCSFGYTSELVTTTMYPYVFVDLFQSALASASDGRLWGTIDSAVVSLPTLTSGSYEIDALLYYFADDVEATLPSLSSGIYETVEDEPYEFADDVEAALPSIQSGEYKFIRITYEHAPDYAAATLPSISSGSYEADV